LKSVHIFIYQGKYLCAVLHAFSLLFFEIMFCSCKMLAKKNMIGTTQFAIDVFNI